MTLSWDGIKNIADITKITIFAYSCYFFFRMGEAVFYGYPFSYISVDSSSLFSVLIKSLMALLVAFFMIKTAIKSSQGAIWNTFIVLISLIVISIIMYLKNKDLHELSTVFVFYIIIYYSLFSIADSIREINKADEGSVQGQGLLKAVFYSWVICFALGNYYYGFAPNGLYQDEDGRVIIAQYNDKYIMKKCQSHGVMATYIVDIPDGMLTPVPENYFVRDVLKAKCKVQSTTSDIKAE
ncbi:hypothetical protein [Serratia marcescens]|uniref:hypothetical protein n=1 Tax=Serratia marcescens TaxID=615 RepID=UPI000D9A766A|nr:hypothetical protein [Serratia marcescens]MDS0826519.1 hypothetical protein [Serratia marcescens]PYA05887.1 hypothetical protein DMW43_10245 [Serratia marcescens]PYA50608.1 hypothetical protein DMW45_05125 [Serratia marcescens]